MFPFYCTFPDCHYTPALLGKQVCIPLIPFNIACNFFFPELGVAFRPFEKFAIMAVPKAAIDENYSPVFGENQIGFSRKVLAVKLIAEPPSEKFLSYNYFRFCILASDARHHFGSMFRRDNISHQAALRFFLTGFFGFELAVIIAFKR